MTERPIKNISNALTMKNPQTEQDFFDGLDEEEAEILRASRSGGLVSVANFEEEKAIFCGLAKAT